MMFLRSMILHSSYTFTPIAKVTTKHRAHYDQNNVYLKNFTCVYAVGCYSLAVRSRFVRAPFRHSVDEYLYVQAPIENRCTQCPKLHCCQPSILVVSKKNDLGRLVVIHFGASCGYIKHFVLGADSNFGSAGMEWNVAYKSFSVSVTFHTTNGQRTKLFMFSVFPIDYLGSITVNKDMKRRGWVKNVTVSLDMLIFQQGKDTIEVYNIYGTVANLKSKDINIECLEELSAPLLTVNRCAGFTLQLGGFPYSLVTGRKGGGYEVRSTSGQMIGVIHPLDADSLQEDSVMFNETESGYIVQHGENTIRSFKVPQLPQAHPLQPAYPPVTFDYFTPSQLPSTSSSGRRITWRIRNVSSSPPAIVCDPDLEDELDLVYVLTCDYHVSPPQVYLNLLDSETLQVLRSLTLDLPLPHINGDYEVACKVTIFGDRDLFGVSWTEHSTRHMKLYQLCNRDTSSLHSCQPVS